MDEGFPKQTIRKIENMNFPLIALDAVRELRIYLDETELEALEKARELGASADDIATALGITRQGAYYKMKGLEKGGRAKRSAGSAASDEDAGDDADPETAVLVPELNEDRAP